jgi:hypothetical protein
VSAVCCHVSLIRDDHFSRGVVPIVVSHCDRAASIMRMAWPTRGCYAMGKKSREREGETGSVYLNVVYTRQCLVIADKTLVSELQ